MLHKQTQNFNKSWFPVIRFYTKFIKIFELFKKLSSFLVLCKIMCVHHFRSSIFLIDLVAVIPLNYTLGQNKVTISILQCLSIAHHTQ